MSLSGVAPMTIPLFMGVALYDACDKNARDNSASEDGSDFFLDMSEALGVLSSAVDPLMEMSFMSSLNSALQTYGTDDALGQVAVNLGKSYVNQFLPTVGGKIARMVDTTVRTTKADATAKEGSVLNNFFRSIAMKTPGASYALEPNVNAKGEVSSKDSFGEWAMDFANQFVLPGRVNVVNRGGVDREIMRIYESTGKSDIFPTVPSRKYFRVNGEDFTMDASQFTSYSEERGTAAYAAIKEVIRSDWYEQMSDADKAAAIADAIDAAEKQVDTRYKEMLGAYD